jgi:hypothetical protein
LTLVTVLSPVLVLNLTLTVEGGCLGLHPPTSVPESEAVVDLSLRVVVVREVWFVGEPPAGRVGDGSNHGDVVPSPAGVEGVSVGPASSEAGQPGVGGGLDGPGNLAVAPEPEAALVQDDVVGGGETKGPSCIDSKEKGLPGGR